MYQYYKSFQLFRITILIAALCFNDVKGQHCVVCNEVHGVDKCSINDTGHFIIAPTDGEVSEPPGGGNGTYMGKDVSACVPDKFQVEDLQGQICFWSPKLGCTDLEKKKSYDFSACQFCYEKCNCPVVSTGNISRADWSILIMCLTASNAFTMY